MKEDHVADDPTFVLSDPDFRTGLFAEQRPLEVLGCGDELVFELFVDRQGTDEAQDFGEVGLGGSADGEWCRHGDP